MREHNPLDRAGDVDLTGAVVLVTGSSRGIGRAIAEAFLQEGAHVILHGRGQGGVRAAAAALSLSPDDALSADLTIGAEIEAMLAQIGERHGRLDVLVNNAGISLSGPFEAHGDSELRSLVATNVRAVQLTCEGALRLMAPARRGLIVNISSNAATTPLPLLAAYSASKAALEALSAVLRARAAPSGVQVVTIAPGAVETDLSAALDPSFAARSNRGIVRLAPSAVAAAVMAAAHLCRQANMKSLILDHFG